LVVVFTPTNLGEMIQFDEYFSNGVENHQLTIAKKYGLFHAGVSSDT